MLAAIDIRRNAPFLKIVLFQFMKPLLSAASPRVHLSGAL